MTRRLGLAFFVLALCACSGASGSVQGGGSDGGGGGRVHLGVPF